MKGCVVMNSSGVSGSIQPALANILLRGVAVNATTEMAIKVDWNDLIVEKCRRGIEATRREKILGTTAIKRFSNEQDITSNVIGLKMLRPIVTTLMRRKHGENSRSRTL